MTSQQSQPPEQALVPLVKLLLDISDAGTLPVKDGQGPPDWEALYALGHHFYQQGRYEEASKVFNYVCLHNHLERRFLIAAAAALQMLKQHERALSLFGFAAMLDPDDPIPIFHSCECLIAQGRVEEALQGISLLKADYDLGPHEKIKSRADGLEALMRQRQASKEGSPA